MDYDDNEFQNQNIHIGSEGSTKYPPASQSYALPRFDFDDSLQGHLKFDSLVDSDVFLGIGSNEDNQWIEDFSRGNSAIAFNSTGADTSSIWIRKNVWSEATSSESVEMLLKSIGQEEVNLSQRTINESVPCYEPGSVTGQMESSSNIVSGSFSKAEDVAESHIITSNEISNNSPELKKGISAEDIQFHHTSQTCSTSLDRHSSDSNMDVVSDKERGYTVAGVNLSTAEQFTEKDEAKRDASKDTLVDNYAVDSVTEKEIGSSVAEVNLPTAVQFTENAEAEKDLIKDKLVDNYAGDLLASDLQVTDKERGSAAEVNLPTAEQFIEKDKEIMDTLEDKLVENSAGDLLASDVQADKERGSDVAEGNSPSAELLTEKDETKTETLKDRLIGNYAGDLLASDLPVTDKERGSAVECNSPSAQQFTKNEEKVHTVKEKLLDNYAGDLSVSDLQVNNNIKCNIELGSQVVSYQSDDKSEKHAEGTEGSCLEGEVQDHGPSSKNSLLDDHNSDGNKVANIVSNLENLCSDSTVVIEDVQMTSKSDFNMDQVSSTAVTLASPDRRVVEDSNKNASRFASPALTVDSSAQMRCSAQEDYLLNSSQKSSIKSSVSEPEKYFMKAEKNLDTVGGVRSSNLQNEGTSNLDVLYTSAESLMGPVKGGVETVVSGGCSETKETTAPAASPILTECKQKCDQSVLSRQVDYVERQNSGPVIVEEGTELSDDPSKNVIKNFGTEVNVEKERQELKSQQDACNEPVPITHVGEVISTSVVVCGPELVSVSEKENAGNSGGEECQEIDNQPILEVNAESEKLSQYVLATETNQGINKKMEVSSAVSEVSASLGRLEDPIGQVNNEKVSTGNVLKDPEGSSGQDALSELNAEHKSSENEGSNAENNKADCDSPTVFKSIDHSQSVDKTEGHRVDGDNSPEVVKENHKDSNKGLSSPRCSGSNDTSKGGESFTFELCSIANLAGTETGKSMQAASTISASMTPQMIAGETLSSPSLSVSEIKTSHDISHESLQQTVGGVVCAAGSKGTSERKSRRTPGKALSKDNAKKGKTLKEATPSRQGKKSVNTSFSPLGICSPLQSTGLHLFGNVECSSGKSFGIHATPTPNVPDLNASTPASALYHQPFTDLQQVQLRAQIFVYGALIQGMVPDEPYMMSAFGGPDGGKHTWENAWRTSMERLQSQKLNTINPVTPSQSHSGLLVSDQLNNSSISRNNIFCGSVGQAGSRSMPSSVMSPIIPLSSPLWAYQTPSSDVLQPSGLPRGPFDFKQAVSPLQSSQTPLTRNVVGHNTWLPQTSFRGPWVASPPTSGPESSTRFPPYPPTEVVKLTPVRESSVRQPLVANNASSEMQSGSPGNVLTSTPLISIDKMMASTVPKPGSKSRKRRKAPISENPETGGLPHSNADMVTIPIGSIGPSTSLGTVTPSYLSSKVSTENIMLQTSSVDNMKNLLDNVEQRVILSEETLGKIKEAEVQAENAASTAAAATNHCQELWNGLARHSTSRLAPDIEGRLSSAVAAISAAACVAKAAAAAANVASNAALQAKLMAEEALIASGYTNVHSDYMNNADATPSNLKSGNGAPISSSVIVVAKETARRRVEAATAASKQAENMDAIVKAAELAAEAVSHAGKIVALGNPIALSELVKSGPEEYWKSHLPPDLTCNSSEGKKEDLGVGSAGEVFDKLGASINKNAKASTRLKSSGSREKADHCNGVGTSGFAAVSTTDGLEVLKVSDVARTIGAVPEAGAATKTSTSVHSDHDIEVKTLTHSRIAEGCLVEILRDGNGPAAWYEANVLDLQDGKAFVCYTELKSDEDSGNLREWVSLDGDNKAPRIRIARPMGATQFEGRRKRRRAAIGDYNWSVGDHVDAWVQNRWYEGIVSGKSKKDSTTFTVQFPALEQKSDVKAWHLRPSLIWRGGNWIESSQSRGKHSTPLESDSPLVKRRRMGTSAIEKGKDKILKNDDTVVSGKQEDVRLLDLAANEKTFNMGKSNRDEKKHESLRSLQTNLQKGGSRVIFGVPKPGKKRKFMEVSKHYVSDQGGKNSEANKSTKIAKHVMPQSSGSRVLKGSSKGGFKEGGAITKPRIPKSGKSHGAATSNTVQKNKDRDSSLSASGEGTVVERDDSMKDSTSNVHNTSGKRELEQSSLCRPDGTAADGSFVFSSVAATSDNPSRRTYTSNKIGRANKGKLAPAGARLNKAEEKVPNRNEANSSSEAMEPRRSNRRIQPTSRLLEGLQSSFISKIPSVSYDRSNRSQSRGALRGSTRR